MLISSPLERGRDWLCGRRGVFSHLTKHTPTPLIPIAIGRESHHPPLFLKSSEHYGRILNYTILLKEYINGFIS